MSRSLPATKQRCLLLSLFAWLVSLYPLCVCAEPEAEPAASSRISLARFSAGARLYAAGKFQRALEHFDAARRLQPTAESGLYRARCLSKLERWVEAYQAYERVAEEVGLSGEADAVPAEEALELTEELVRKEQGAVSAHLGFIAVKVQDPPKYTRLVVNEQTVPKERWERVPVEPGQVDVSLVTPFRPRVGLALELNAGDSVSVDIAPPPALVASVVEPGVDARYFAELPGPRHSRLTAVAYDAAALGAVGLGAYGVFHEMSADTLEGVETLCERDECEPDKNRRLQNGTLQQLWARVGLAVGLVGVGSAVTIWVLDEDEDKQTSLRLSPSGLFVHGKL